MPVTGLKITVFSKDGLTKVADEVPFHDATGPITIMKAFESGWVTLGGIVPPEESYDPTTYKKYSYMIYWDRPVITPYRGMVAEVKEIIYDLPQPISESENPCWNPGLIKCWSETIRP